MKACMFVKMIVRVLVVYVKVKRGGGDNFLISLKIL